MTHVSNIMQRFLTIQTISPNEKFIFIGNEVKAPVKIVETYCLKHNTGHRLDLLETPYVPSLFRNLVSLSKLDVIGYSFNFGNVWFILFKHNHLIGTIVLCDGLYKLKHPLPKLKEYAVTSSLDNETNFLDKLGT